MLWSFRALGSTETIHPVIMISYPMEMKLIRFFLNSKRQVLNEYTPCRQDNRMSSPL
jgi:hypothetical protein